MGEKRDAIVRVLTVLACISSAGLLGPAATAFEERATLPADALVLRNLIGRIDVEGHDGSSFEVEIRVQGSDATPDRVVIETTQGRNAEVDIRFPLDESRRFCYVYPEASGSTSFSLDEDSSWLAKLFGSGNVKVSKSGGGLEIWADVRVPVPRGKMLVVDHGVGTIIAQDVDGGLELSTRSGPVQVDDVRGPVSVDTGSGRVSLADIAGDLHVDTGSGGVTASDVRSDSVLIDTGSGRMELEDVDCAILEVDTGSGGVRAEGIGADELTIDTGSGSVTLELERMGTGSFVIDTGSGSIELRLPENASVDVVADTGSGGIELDLAPGYRMRREGEDEAELTIGGGEAHLLLDTGRGSIRISQ